jgi:hypothetical protein
MLDYDFANTIFSGEETHLHVNDTVYLFFDDFYQINAAYKKLIPVNAFFVKRFKEYSAMKKVNNIIAHYISENTIALGKDENNNMAVLVSFEEIVNSKSVYSYKLYLMSNNNLQTYKVKYNYGNTNLANDIDKYDVYKFKIASNKIILKGKKRYKLERIDK